jgi:adenylate cyclase
VAAILAADVVGYSRLMGKDEEGTLSALKAIRRELCDPKIKEHRGRINLGDIIIDEGDIFGDGVNVAARLEAMAVPGGICVSRVARDQLRDKFDFVFEDMGEQR